MRKTLLLTLLIIIITSTQVLASNHSKAYFLADENYISIEEYDFKPMHIEHHTCGYGGTSCRTCYTQSKIGWCGCRMVWYKCCCGATVATWEYYCSQHPLP